MPGVGGSPLRRMHKTMTANPVAPKVGMMKKTRLRTRR
jgi:hypothetical protein